MNRVFVLIALLLFSIMCHAQRWQAGLSAGGGINGKKTEVTNSHEYNSGSWNSTLTTFMTLNSSADLWLGYQIGQRWQIRTGAGYQFLRFQSKYDYRNYFSSGIPRHFVLTNTSWEQCWLHIPLTVQYYLADIDQKWRPMLFAGAQAEWLHQLQRAEGQIEINQREEVNHDFTENQLDLTDTHFPYRRWNFNAQLGVGITHGRAAIYFTYTGTFQSHSPAQYYDLDFYYFNLSQAIRPLAFTNGSRFTIPGRLGLQFQYQLL